MSQVGSMSKRRQISSTLLKLIPWAYLFFLSIALMGGGMKASFKDALKHYLHDHAGEFTELVSFVIGVLGTSLVQSSSTVTSMAVVLTQEGIVPLIIAIGIVHGANLGTSVTSTIVAFFAEVPGFTGNPFRDFWHMLVRTRERGFHTAVGTAVVHGLFNVILVTGILIALELPFGIIHRASEWSAHVIGDGLASSAVLLDIFAWVSPSTYTKPVASALLDIGVPGWVLVLLGFGALFAALRGFSNTMKSALLLDNADPTDDVDVAALGQKLLGTHPLDTFARGLFLTILVQSSSATTSMVVPLAAMGLFSIRQILPFIMGANIGTTTTALLAASAAVGQPGFEAGLTIALAHFYLNTLAVVLVVAIPPLQTSVLGATEFLADQAARLPAVLILYLVGLSVVMPAIVFISPNWLSTVFLGAVTVVSVVGPHYYLRNKVVPLATEPDLLAAK